MLIFTVLLGIMTGILWLVPKYGASKNRDLIALRSSGTGCLSLIAAGLLAVLAVLLLRLPHSILMLFVIAFFTLPLIAGLLSAFIAVKAFRRVGGEGGAPTVRAILYYLLLGVIGITVWFGEKCIEMRKVRETWSVEYPVPVSGIRRVAVTQQLVNPVIEKYDGSLLVTDEKGGVRSTALLRDRFDGRRIVNLYELSGIPSVPGPLFLFADGQSVHLVDPAAMRILPVECREESVTAGGQDITAWDIFNRARYLGVFRGGCFLTPDQAKVLPLRVMYENRKSAVDPGGNTADRSSARTQ